MACGALRQRYGPLRRAFLLRKLHISRIKTGRPGTAPSANNGAEIAQGDGPSECALHLGSSLGDFPIRRSIGITGFCSGLQCASKWPDALVTVASSMSANFNTMFVRNLAKSLSAVDISSAEVRSD
jgi:hypothetical protein